MRWLFLLLILTGCATLETDIKRLREQYKDGLKIPFTDGQCRLTMENWDKVYAEVRFFKDWRTYFSLSPSYHSLFLERRFWL
jgi:hypothetical protein